MLQVHNIARLFLALQGDTRVSPLLKLQAWCGLVYIFSPLDIMPEMFTGIGLLDDIIVALIIMQAMLELAPRHVVDEHCARIGIRPEQIFISVPQTIREARSLYAFVRTVGSGFRGVADAGEPQAAAAAEPADDDSTVPLSKTGSRYSAYRGDNEQGE